MAIRRARSRRVAVLADAGALPRPTRVVRQLRGSAPTVLEHTPDATPVLLGRSRAWLEAGGCGLFSWTNWCTLPGAGTTDDLPLTWADGSARASNERRHGPARNNAYGDRPVGGGHIWTTLRGSSMSSLPFLVSMARVSFATIFRLLGFPLTGYARCYGSS